MKEMVSGINSIPTSTVRKVHSLKEGQDEATSQLASDTTGIIGVGDTDLVSFLTPAFKGLRMLQVKSGGEMYGTLGLIPQQQHPYDGGFPFFRDGSVVALDRAGSASFTNNIVRTGPPPDGFIRNNETILIQRRVARTFNPAIDRVSYGLETEYVPRDYVLAPNERFDGDFSPANALGLGSDYTSIFPVDDQGRRLYNGDPYTEAGWDGTVYTVVYNAETIPVPTAIVPNTYQLPDNGGVHSGIIFGQHFTVNMLNMIGPYRAPLSSLFSDAFAFEFPSNMEPDVYDVIVIGEDGQMGILTNSFTVLAEVI